MKVNIDEFKSKNAPAARPSKFRAFDAEIGALIADGYTQEQVLEFLRLNGLKASKGGLSSYIARRKQEDENYG